MGRRLGAKTKRRNHGLFKKCDCAKWSKCGHPWHLTFTYKRPKPYRYSLNKWAEKPVGYAMSKSEAERLRDRLRDLIRNGHAPGSESEPTPTIDTPLTLDDVAKRYVEYFATQTWRGEKRRAHRVPRMVNELAVICRTLVPAAQGTTMRFGDKIFTRIVAGDIDAWRDSRRAFLRANEQEKLTQSTERPRARGGEIGLNRYLQTLRTVFNFGIRKGFYTHSSPFRLHGESVIDFTKEQARSRRLLPGEEERLLDAAKAVPHLCDLIVIALETGMRRGESFGLQWMHVIFDRDDQPRYIDLPAWLTKTNEKRRVYVTPRLADVLRRRRCAPDGTPHPPTAFVFGNAVGEQFDTIKTSWQSACKRAGIENLTYHDLRRTFGSRLLERGASLMTVSRLLGHKLLTTTNTYLKPAEALVEQEHRRLFPWPVEKRRATANKRASGVH